MVTGASSGIGRAFAIVCAGGGYNVLLAGRDERALREAAAECGADSNVETEIVVADLAHAEGVDALVEALGAETREIAILANNAGFGVHGPFASTDITGELDLVHVQLAAALRLTKAVLPGMIARRSGRILNVASVYSYSPVPLQSVYAACKAFLLSFSASLGNELGGSGVTVTAFCPGITETSFRTRAGIADKKSRGLGMTAEDAARIAYVETLRGNPVVIPGLANRLFVLAARILPSTAFTGIIRSINGLRGHQK